GALLCVDPDEPAPDANDTFLRAFQRQAATATPMPAVRAMRAVWEPAARAIRKSLRRDVPPARALEEAARRFRDVRRPPPTPADPTIILVLLGAFGLGGALLMVQRARQPEMRARLRASLPAYRYVLHGVILVGLLVIGPILVGAATSLFAGQPHQMYYVGVQHFVDILTARSGDLFASGSFYVVLAVTVVWTVTNVVLHLAIGVSLAVILSRPLLKLKTVYRVLLVLPWSVPSYVTALAWKGMFHRQFGAVTGIIQGINEWFGTDLEPISWFATFGTSFAANLATNVWLGFPFMMVVTLGALTAVPKDVLEAAEVDGATPFQRLWHVTLPMIKPTMIPATVLGSIWTFNMFNVVFLVSGGEPDGTTDILISEAYRWAFTREARYGYAAAYAVLIFLILAAASTAGARWIDRAKERA
ncbi:MAG: ABC transporter permease subunit, partial [Nannocystaceae bacterium]